MRPWHDIKCVIRGLSRCQHEVSVESIVAALLLLYPFLLLAIRSGTNACFAVLIILALFQIVKAPARYVGNMRDDTVYLYNAAMASPVIATLISQLYHRNFKIGPYDGASRFLFCIPIYLFLRQIPTRYLTVIQYGFVGGACTTIAIAILYRHDAETRLGTYFVNVIHFGDLALVLGIMACMTINWDRLDSFAVVALKIGGLLGGLNAIILSGTRGGWLAVPAVFAVWAGLMSKRLSAVVLILATLGLVLALIGLFEFVAPVHERLLSLTDELLTVHANRDTSTGLRLQIWNAALHLFAQNPIFGVGPGQFANLAPKLGSEGYLTPMGVELARAEVHNEILTHTVALGIFGLASALLIYFVPFAIFLRATRSPDHTKRRAGILGACLVTAFVVFGLTVETFDLKMTATFYSLTIAVLLAIATNSAEGDESKNLRS